MKLKATSLALLFSVVVGCVNCSASNSSGSSDSSAVLDTKSDETGNEPRGMLKAFGLKGKVKTLTLYIVDDETGGFVLAFDPQGNYYKFDNYNGEEVGFEVEDTGAFCSIGIDNWKITDMMFSPRWNGGTT